ncbi:hypothetical protein EKO04_006825 [Ascochyta lentis]|uniref:Uncharacterized protein n=1 Tax=Ascochyta lentis TaxID=205686 RepID=A0A8H7MHI2_9PLEO|nr:hypothetical protein EKO04_006825 [Ascochyta lentis]
MLISIVLLLSLTLGGQTYASPVDETVNEDTVLHHWNISELITGNPIDGGKIETIPIPQLTDFDLVLKDGHLVYDIPEGGIDIPEQLYEKLSGKKPNTLKKRDCSNPCNCGTHRVWDLSNANWNKFLGNYKVMSSPICGPGSITKTYTSSYSYQVSGSLDPSLGIKLDKIFLEKLGFKVGFAYTWGTAVATGYTATCGEAHPCIATFRPQIGQVTGRARWTELTNDYNKLCGSGYSGNIEIHLPTVRDCNDKQCGADGVWDHCYYVGNAAKALCHYLGPTPRSQCPASLYPGGR